MWFRSHRQKNISVISYTYQTFYLRLLAHYIWCRQKHPNQNLNSRHRVTTLTNQKPCKKIPQLRACHMSLITFTLATLISQQPPLHVYSSSVYCAMWLYYLVFTTLYKFYRQRQDIAWLYKDNIQKNSEERSWETENFRYEVMIKGEIITRLDRGPNTASQNK